MTPPNSIVRGRRALMLCCDIKRTDEVSFECRVEFLQFIDLLFPDREFDVFVDRQIWIALPEKAAIHNSTVLVDITSRKDFVSAATM
jgi:hypothetical protein